jgi:hypothetical protein
MASKEDKQDQDDLSFLRTEDFICLNCSVTMQNGITRRLALSAEAFGNKMCFLEDISVEVKKNTRLFHFNFFFFSNRFSFSNRMLRQTCPRAFLFLNKLFRFEPCKK